MKYYIAGGAVRDLLLGLPLRDFDCIFEGSEEEFLQGNPKARKVRDLPLPIYILEGREYTRAAPEGLKADVLRRDFTINALILSGDGVLRAHPQSFRDLAAGLIRPTSPTAIHDDPVRVFRAARLTAALPGFALHAECIDQMRAADIRQLSSIAPEQVGKELLKACASIKPGNFIRSLAKGKCLDPWFAELERSHEIPAGPPEYHGNYSVMEHTAHIMDATAQAFFSLDDEKTQRPLAVWMALCHDLGKVLTPPEMLPKHIGHEKSGTGAALALGERLRLPRNYIKAGALAAKLHMKAGRYPFLRPGTKTDLLMDAHAAGLFRPLFLLAAQDSHNPELLAQAKADLEVVLRVRLPEEMRGRGELSGKILRELRCEALVKRRDAMPVENKKPPA